MLPTTIGGLLVFAVALVPGFLTVIQRRKASPQRSPSALVEAATMVSVSLATNIVAIAAFAIARWAVSDHTPDVRRLLEDGAEYVTPRVGYLFAWCVGLVAVSCGVALLLANPPRRLAWVTRKVTRLAPIIVDEPAWYHTFEAAPPGATVYVGLDFHDGSYISGTLDWYSTEVDETGDRDLVLAPPLIVKAHGHTTEVADFARLIVSARDVGRIYVSYLAPGTPAG